jgi:tetraacyldisaccharide 4'-kinase
MPDDPAPLVGDEALLLVRVAPTWTGADRAASARSATAAGADMLLMDDGLQNPTLEKSLSLLVIDGATGFGNGRVLPAGPLRESVSAAVARVQAAVLIGPDSVGATRLLPTSLPILRADLVQDPAIRELSGRRVLAFAGIALPDKFFIPLRQAGAIVTEARPFPDHHPYSARDLEDLTRSAAAMDAILVTTPKDAVRLPASMRERVTVIGVGLAWEDARQIDDILQKVIDAVPPVMA